MARRARSAGAKGPAAADHRQAAVVVDGQRGWTPVREGGVRRRRAGYPAGMLHQDWAAVARTLVAAPLAYAVLLLVVRISGKRALAKLNAFDLVVTVSLGSVLASVAVSSDVAVSTAATAFVLLIGLQYLIAFLSVRVPAFQRLVRAQPTLLVRDGRWLDEAMARQRVSRSEVLQVLRQRGLASLDQAAAVVLETDGTLSVITNPPDADAASTLANVAGWA